VLVVVIVVAATAVIMVVSMVMVMSMIVAVAVPIPMSMAASLTGGMVMAAVMLGLGSLLGRQKGAHALIAVVIGFGCEVIYRGQRFEAHAFQLLSDGIGPMLTPGELDEVVTGFKGDTRRRQQSGCAQQRDGLLTGDDVQFDSVHG
jgi:hypothetical protein